MVRVRRYEEFLERAEGKENDLGRMREALRQVGAVLRSERK